MATGSRRTCWRSRGSAAPSSGAGATGSGSPASDEERGRLREHQKFGKKVARTDRSTAWERAAARVEAVAMAGKYEGGVCHR